MHEGLAWTWESLQKVYIITFEDRWRLIPWQSLAKVQPIADNCTQNELHDDAIEFWNAAAKKLKFDENLLNCCSTADLVWPTYNIAYSAGWAYLKRRNLFRRSSRSSRSCPAGGKAISVREHHLPMSNVETFVMWCIAEAERRACGIEQGLNSVTCQTYSSEKISDHHSNRRWWTYRVFYLRSSQCNVIPGTTIFFWLVSRDTSLPASCFPAFV